MLPSLSRASARSVRLLLVLLAVGFAAPSALARDGRPRLVQVTPYSQNDPRWAKDRIGGSNETLKRVGCVVTSVAMALSHFGYDLTPRELNAFFKEHDGYSRRGWLRWDRVARLTKGRVKLVHAGGPDYGLIDRNLAEGRPVIVKTRSKRGSIHWVLVVGREGRDYLVMDPLRRDGRPVPLSKVARRVLAMRVFARAR